MQIENRVFRMLINGKLVSGGEMFEVLNPATGMRLASAPKGTLEHVSKAVVAAREGFRVWSKLPQLERSQLLLQAATIVEGNKIDLAYLLSQEQGKPLAGATAETETAITMLRQAADVKLPVKLVKETVEHVLQVRRVPVGVVAGITPWNYPLSMACGKLARSLAHGNSVILKPSPFTPLTTLYLGELLGDLFPPGVVNVVSGDDIPGQESVGAQLVANPGINLVSFTGSVPTGKRIMASCASNMTRVLLELGGNDPAIVLADADVAHAAKGIFQIAMANSGQICCAVKRVYVHESLFDEFVTHVRQMALELVPGIGEGIADGVKMGPLNNEAQLDRIKELVADAVLHGACVEAGGKPPAHTHAGGFFFEPTVLTNVSEGMRIVDEEQFGPIMPVMKFSTTDEVIKRANDSVFGLGASVWGRDPETLNQVALSLEAGIVWTNQHAVLREGAAFGGMKQSGFRHEGDFAEADLESYTEMQTIKLAK